jgi:hypothetical protein
MNEKTKLILALQQIENIISLIKGNEYQQFLDSHLLPVRYELQRQLTNQTISIKITE